jgi:SAM-dependent methyltransferase
MERSKISQKSSINIMENINCIFCNASNEPIAIRENGYTGRKCNKCALIYISPRPSYSEIVNIYSEEKALTYAESIIPDDHSKRLIARNTLRLLKRYKKEGAILELGAGAGYFLDEAKKVGFEVYGIEPNKIQADFIANILNIRCEIDELNDSSFGGRNFEIIYHCNVLSHLYDPIGEFKKMNMKLKPDGVLIFETGNLGEVDNKYFTLFAKFGYPDHLFFFGKLSIRNLLEQTGFELVDTFEYSKVPLLLKNIIISAIRKPGTNKRKKLERRTISKVNRPRSTLYLKSFMKKAHGYLSYLLLYVLGRLMFKKGRPQTIIIIARKKSVL